MSCNAMQRNANQCNATPCNVKMLFLGENATNKNLFRSLFLNVFGAVFGFLKLCMIKSDKNGAQKRILQKKPTWIGGSSNFLAQLCQILFKHRLNYRGGGKQFLISRIRYWWTTLRRPHEDKNTHVWYQNKGIVILFWFLKKLIFQTLPF